MMRKWSHNPWILTKPMVRRSLPLRDSAVSCRNFGRLVVFGVVLCLIAPCVAAGQSLTIISDPLPPFGYVKGEEIVGFTVDLIKSLLKRTGIDGKFVMYPWARAYEMAQNEKDILIYQLSHSKERNRLFQLVGPILHESEYLYKLKDRQDIVVKNLADAKRYFVGTVRDYHHHKYLLENGFEEGKNLEATSGEDMNIKKLTSGRIDLMISSEIAFSYRVGELGYNRDDYEKILVVMSNDSYIAFSRQTSPKVVLRFKEALEAMKKDGSYERLLRKYGVHPPKGKTD